MSTLGRISMGRIGACVLALAVCCGCVAVRRAAAEDARKREPQLSADQEECPLTDITETTDASGVIWGKGMHNGMLREWRLQIPPTNPKPVPLYAYFHGAAGWMTKFDEFDGVLATSNERILLIGKGGIPDFDWDRNREDFSWNAANDPEHPRDLDFARKLIRYVQETYNVDKSRVYAAGYSGGSFMAQAMVAVHSDLFAACVSWAGYLTYRESTFPEDFNYKPIPILQMHSTDDPLVRYEPYKPDPALIGAMPNFQLWLGHNGCDPADIPEGKPNRNGFIEFAGEKCDAPVVHYQYSNIGHGGGDPELAFEWALQFTKQQDSASQIDSARDTDKQHGYKVNGEVEPSNQKDTADSRSRSATTQGSSGGGTIGGRVPMSWVFFSRGNKKSEISVFTERGSVTLEALDVYELKSIWNGGRDEIYRPQFHYSPQTGEMGDPNGLVYYDGEYHLFYQRGAWGHAVSTDMIHWQQLPDALTPDEHAGGHSVYSGSCVVDYDNTAGFKTGDKDVIVAIYTINNDGMQSQALAYSNDRGRTFTAYAGNPVMASEYDKRDPKVFWYESDSKWVMALHNKYGVDFYSSPNLKDWTYMSRVEGFYECPDIFELPVDGDPKNTKWVLLDASNSGYKLGQFDGTAFIPETPGMPIDFGRNHYATQTFSNIPRSDGRTIQMAWMKSARYPGMPFDQQQTFPSELSLRTYADGVRLCRAPIREIERIRGKHYKWSNEILERGEDLLSGINHDLIEIIAVFDLTDATSPEFGFFLRDALIYYYVAGSKIFVEHNNISKTATLKPKNNKISMHILLDRASLEVYAN